MTQNEQTERQEYYRETRRLWAIATGKPYLEDSGRSGDAAPRQAATDKEGST